MERMKKENVYNSISPENLMLVTEDPRKMDEAIVELTDTRKPIFVRTVDFDNEGNELGNLMFTLIYDSETKKLKGKGRMRYADGYKTVFGKPELDYSEENVVLLKTQFQELVKGTEEFGGPAQNDKEVSFPLDVPNDELIKLMNDSGMFNIGVYTPVKDGEA